MKTFKLEVWQKVTPAEIEDMLYQIGLRGDKKEAKRFSKLSFPTQQKVAYILKRREMRARRVELHIDVFLIREVINDAQAGIFIDL